MILIKPKKGNEKGQVAIAVGYGLEGVVPDAIASRIIRNEVIPEFQKGRYYAGVDKATNVLMDLTGGEYTADEYAKRTGEGGLAWLWIPLGILFLIPLFVKRRKGYTTGGHDKDGFPPIFFGGFGGGSSFGSFRGGSGSFGGFGGGSFGGGGASGSW